MKIINELLGGLEYIIKNYGMNPQLEINIDKIQILLKILRMYNNNDGGSTLPSKHPLDQLEDLESSFLQAKLPSVPIKFPDVPTKTPSKTKQSIQIGGIKKYLLKIKKMRKLII